MGLTAQQGFPLFNRASQQRGHPVIDNARHNLIRRMSQ